MMAVIGRTLVLRRVMLEIFLKVHATWPQRSNGPASSRNGLSGVGKNKMSQ